MSTQLQRKNFATGIVGPCSATAPVPRRNLEQEQNIFAQVQLRTAESALGNDYAQAKENLEQQDLMQAQGVHRELLRKRRKEV